MLKKLCFTLLLTLALPGVFAGYGYFKGLADVRNRILKDAILAPYMESFQSLSERLALYINSFGWLFQDDLMKNSSWIDELKRKDQIAGARILYNITESSAEYQALAKRGGERYYIDRDGLIYYIYYSAEKRLIAELALSFEDYPQFLGTIRIRPQWIVIHEEKSGLSAAVFQESGEVSIPAKWSGLSNEIRVSFSGVREFSFSGPLRGSEKSLMIIAHYSLRIGKESLLLLGLFIILILAIILVAGTIIYGFSGPKKANIKGIFMQGVEKEDIISSIEKELSKAPIVSAGKGEKRQGDESAGEAAEGEGLEETDVKQGKGEKREEPGESEAKKLERDGIFIRKT